MKFHIRRKTIQNEYDYTQNNYSTGLRQKKEKQTNVTTRSKMTTVRDNTSKKNCKTKQFLSLCQPCSYVTEVGAYSPWFKTTGTSTKVLHPNTHLACCSQGCSCLLLSDSGTETTPGPEQRSFPSRWAGPCDWGWLCGSASGRDHRAPPLCAGLVWRVPVSNHTTGLWWSPRSQSWGI